MSRASALILGLLFIASVGFHAAAQADGARFEVASIKRSAPSANVESMSYRPDGSLTRINVVLRGLVLAAAPESVAELEGVPDWVNTDHYDVIAKAPENATSAQRPEMIRNMMIERLKLAGHIEPRERTVYSLVFARADKRLGANLKPAIPECSGENAAPRQGPAPFCGIDRVGDALVSKGAMMIQLTTSLSRLAGGPVVDTPASRVATPSSSMCCSLISAARRTIPV